MTVKIRGDLRSPPFIVRLIPPVNESPELVRKVSPSVSRVLSSACLRATALPKSFVAEGNSKISSHATKRFVWVAVRHQTGPRSLIILSGGEWRSSTKGCRPVQPMTLHPRYAYVRCNENVVRKCERKPKSSGRVEKFQSAPRGPFRSAVPSSPREYQPGARELIIKTIFPHYPATRLSRSSQRKSEKHKRGREHREK